MNARGVGPQDRGGFRSLEMQRQLVRRPSVFDNVLKKASGSSAAGFLRPGLSSAAPSSSPPTAKIGTHMSGSAIDISVFRRDGSGEVWRGVPYLEMSERTPMRSPYITAEELENRLAITEMMEARGFMHFPFEFWHFNKGDAGGHILTGNPEPCRYGPVNWNPETNEVTAVPDPAHPAQSPRRDRARDRRGVWSGRSTRERGLTLIRRGSSDLALGEVRVAASRGATR